MRERNQKAKESPTEPTADRGVESIQDVRGVTDEPVSDGGALTGALTDPDAVIDEYLAKKRGERSPLGHPVYLVRFDFDLQFDGKLSSTWGSKIDNVRGYRVFFNGSVFTVVSPAGNSIRSPLAKVKTFQLESDVVEKK